MKFKPLTVILLAFAIIISIGAKNPTQNEDAILGRWLNQDKTAKFEIFKQNGRYFGKIIWGTGKNSKDVHNPNPQLRNRDLVGLLLLNNFEYAGNLKWTNGTIYDPNNGKTYNCQLTLNTNNQLDVRGYIGFSLFGKSETWSKVK